MKNTNKHIKEQKNSFKTPKGYFETIENSVFEKLNLNETQRKDSFVVPDSYFDTIENRVIERLNSAKKPIIKTISFKNVIFKYIIPISIAATFILFSSILFLKNNKVNFNQLAQVDIENWLDENIEDINTYTIDDAYNDVTFDELSIFTDNELSNYLEETDIETLELTN